MMYGLAAVDRGRGIDFDAAGNAFEYEYGTGAITLCDVVLTASCSRWARASRSRKSQTG